MAYQIEGMIVLSHTISSEELAALHLPIVTMEREDRHVCSVNTDNYAGGRQAAQLLDECGCDVLLHITRPPAPSSRPTAASPAFWTTARTTACATS